MVTLGYLITHGVGLLSIMEDGTSTTITDGHGYQDMSGHRHGFHGEVVVDTMDGLQCLPDLI